VIGCEKLILLIMGAPTRALTNRDLSIIFLILLKIGYMGKDDACELISQSGHPFKSYDQKSKLSIYVSIIGWGRLGSVWNS